MIHFDTLTSGSRAIICISIVLMCGFLMTRITKRLSLPNVTAYIVTGILLGPYVLNIIPLSFVEGSSFLPGCGDLSGRTAKRQLRRNE